MMLRLRDYDALRLGLLRPSGFLLAFKVPCERSLTGLGAPQPDSIGNMIVCCLLVLAMWIAMILAAYLKTRGEQHDED